MVGPKPDQPDRLLRPCQLANLLNTVKVCTVHAYIKLSLQCEHVCMKQSLACIVILNLAIAIGTLLQLHCYSYLTKRTFLAIQLGLMDHNRSRIPYSYVIHYTFNYTWLVIIIFAYYLVHGENNYLQGQKAVLHGYSYV